MAGDGTNPTSRKPKRRCRLTGWLLHPVLSLLAPGFWEQFPKDDQPGPWVAEAIVVSPFYRSVKLAKLVRGRKQAAYVMARRLALTVDYWMIPSGKDCELGVDWCIRHPTPEEIKRGVA